MRLCGFELQKLFGRRYVIVGLLLILVANLFFLSATNESKLSSNNAVAYKALMSDIENLPLQEKQAVVSEQLDTVYALIQIDNYLKTDAAYATREEFISLYEGYGAIYEAGSYKLYTGNLYTELPFLSTVRSELETVAGYPDFLQTIWDQAALYNQISIFSRSDSFDSRNIEKTVADYEKLAKYDIVIDYYPQKGFLTAITFEYTDVFILVAMLLLAGILITGERESGLLNYIRSTARGRTRTAVAKCLALLVSTFAIVVLLYGINILYASISYGLGDLNRSIQSLPFLMRSVLPLTLFQYLLLFLAAKWFSAFVLGLCIMLLIFCAKRFIAGMVLSVLLYGSQWALYTFIRPNNTYSIFRYINFVGILKVNEWVGGYLNFNVAGTPVSIFSTILLSALVFLVVLFASFTALFSNSAVQTRYAAPAKKVNRRVKPTTVFREEAYKTLFLGGAAPLLLLFFLFQIWQGISADSFITAEEIYYRHKERKEYMKQKVQANNTLFEKANS